MPSSQGALEELGRKARLQPDGGRLAKAGPACLAGLGGKWSLGTEVTPEQGTEGQEALREQKLCLPIREPLSAIINLV